MRVMLDVGSFVGWCARFWSDTADRVIAWEPNPVSRRCVQANCGHIANIEIRPQALTDRQGHGHLGFNTPQHYGNCTLKDSGFSVELHTLDSQHLGAVDFIKIDVEGAEYSMLEGARETIQACRPVIQVEVNEMCHHHGRSEQDVHDLLEGMGMTMQMHDGQWDYVYAFPR